MVDILNTLDRVRGKRFLILASIQSWKSLAAQLYCQASIFLRPARMAWYAPGRDFLREFAEEKFNPLFESIELSERLMPKDRHKSKTLSKQFAHMPFTMLSSSTQSSRQSKTLQVIVCDEAWMYEPGHLTEIEGRYTSYVKEGSWQFVVPTSCSNLNDEVHEIYKGSDQRLAHVACQSCGCSFYPDVYPKTPIESIDDQTGEVSVSTPPGGLKYDSSENVRDNEGRIVSEPFNKSVYYECPKCSDRLKGLDLETARYIPTRIGADLDISWKHNALLHLPLHYVARLKAQAEDALEHGDFSEQEDFDRKRGIRFWSLQRHLKDDSSTSNIGNYKLGEKWSEEHARFMLIDVQQGFYWYLIRLWSKLTHSRLYLCGQEVQIEEINKIAESNGLKGYQGDLREDTETGQLFFGSGCDIFIDGNYDVARVRYLAAKYQWCILRGLPGDQKRFVHPDGKYRIWSPIRAQETFAGVEAPNSEEAQRVDRYVPEIQFAKNEARGILRMLKNIANPRPIHTYPKNIDDEEEGCVDYLKHQKAWVLEWKPRRKDSQELVAEWKQVGNQHDDLEWCECGQVVAASTVGLIGSDATDNPKEELKIELENSNS